MRLCILASLLTGCSLQVTERTLCAEDADCRAAFGLGSVCDTAEGFCESADPPPRCDVSYPDDLLSNPTRYRNAIVVGSLFNRSDADGANRELAVELAVQMVNDQGGLEGLLFGLVRCTTEVDFSLFTEDSEEAAAVSAATYLVDRLGAPALIGADSFAATREVYRALEDRDVVVITPSVINPGFASLEMGDVSDSQPGTLWRTVPSAAWQGPAINLDLTCPGDGRTTGSFDVAVIQASTTYGEDVYEAFASAFDPHTATLFEVFNPDSAQSLRDAVAAAAAVDPLDEVVFLSDTKAAEFLEYAADEPGLTDKRFFVGGDVTSADINSGIQDRATLYPNVRGSRLAPTDSNDSTNAYFASRFAATYADYETDVYYSNAYDASWMTLAGAAWSLLREGAVTGRGIARGFRKLVEGTRFRVRAENWNPMVEELRTGASIDLAGASGPLDFDLVSEELPGVVEIWDITGAAVPYTLNDLETHTIPFVCPP